MPKPLTPFNLEPLHLTPTDVRHLKQVKVPDIFDGNTSNFHPEGLYSTEIFGNVGTEARDNSFAYIDLKLSVIHPFMLKILFQLKQMYKDIVTGKAYVKWDEKEKDFVPSNQLEGDTGFYYFLAHWKQIEFKRTSSKLRDEKILFYNKFKDIAEIDKIIVYPAGLRDVQVDELGRVKKDEVNDYYTALISISNAVSKDVSRSNTKFMDTTRVSLQNNVVAVYDYFNTIIEGKGGSLQKQLSSRNIYYGTRNVITPFAVEVNNVSSPTAPNSNNSVVGLFQIMNAVLPYVKNWMLNTWSKRIFSSPDGNATLINRETLKQESVRLQVDVVEKWNTSSGIETLVGNFQYPNLRNKPVIIDNHYLALIWRDDEYFKIMFDIDELPKDDPRFSPKDVRPITYIEMFYLCGYREWNKIPAFVTRYPIEGNGSIFPSYSYLRTTLNDFQLYELGDDWRPLGEEFLALSYPDTSTDNFMDAFSCHPSHLQAMGGDLINYEIEWSSLVETLSYKYALNCRNSVKT